MGTGRALRGVLGSARALLGFMGHIVFEGLLSSSQQNVLLGV